MMTWIKPGLSRMVLALLCLVLAVLPAAAGAESPEYYEAGLQVAGILDEMVQSHDYLEMMIPYNDAAQELIDALKDNPGLQSYIYEGFGHAAYDLAPDYKERMLEFFRD